MCPNQAGEAGAAGQDPSGCSGQKGLFCDTTARVCVQPSSWAASSECRAEDARFVCSMVARDGEPCGSEGASCCYLLLALAAPAGYRAGSAATERARARRTNQLEIGAKFAGLCGRLIPSLTA